MTRWFNQYPQYKPSFCGNQHARGIQHGAICHGKPCIRGLRYPVETILELLISDMSIDEVL